MKLYIVHFIACICLFGCAKNKHYLKTQTQFQKELNATFKDVTKSPLTTKDRKDFKGLHFFKFDVNYIVKANLKRTPSSNWFDLMTTTNRISKERVYGVLTFKLKGKQFNLNVYQEKELVTSKGYENYLFLPFLDQTNGVESYAGGRYIDCEIPEGDTLIIDFNQAYNPYCAYNSKYSCPIVPQENYLTTRIEAGVKVFK